MANGNGEISDEEALEELFEEEGEIAEDGDLGIAVYASPRATKIAQISSSMGFAPRRESNAFVAEYSKTYGIPGGTRAAQATAQFDKGVAGLEHARLKGFVVTVTAYLPAIPETIREQAPEVMRADLLNYVDKLGGLGDIEAPKSLVMIRCDGCGKETPEFFSIQNSRFCRACFTRKVGGAPPE